MTTRERAMNEARKSGKALPDVSDNVPEKENISVQAALAEAIEFAAQDGQSLTPAGEAMVRRWQNALAEAQKHWRSLDTAPEDCRVILGTAGNWVGEAIMLRDEDTGEQVWTWVDTGKPSLHSCYGWMPLPEPLLVPVRSDI